jgi:O-Antigen ligase
LSVGTLSTAFPADAAFQQSDVVRGEAFRLALLWLMAFSGGFVFIEPGPYEICAVLTIAVFALTGLTMPRRLAPLIVMLVVYDIGYALAMLQVIDQPKSLTWVFVSWYLTITAMFFAAILAHNTERRLEMVVRGCIAAAVVASLAGILAYFHLLGGLSETFLKFSRARGTFNDPNVLGAFLVFPGLLLLQRIIAGRITTMLFNGAALAIVIMALLLSFSRAAWGQFAGTAALLMLLTFITSRSNRERVRIILMAALGGALLVMLIVALLSLEQVGDLFKERASLDQSYDTGPMGRFGRYATGFTMALERPLGIGPLQFTKIFPEDPHNTFLNAFMTGGWIVGLLYPTIVLTTLGLGLRYVFIAAPWRRTYLAAFCALVGTVGESAIIDIDHWRHFFLQLGLVWGLILATQAYRLSASAGSTRAALGINGGIAMVRSAPR